MKPLKAKDRMKRYRSRKQATGMRLIQLWVPDTRSPRFAAEIRRRSRMLKGDPAEAEALEFIDRVADWEGDAPR
jgi:hypothetical protein